MKSKESIFDATLNNLIVYNSENNGSSQTLLKQEVVEYEIISHKCNLRPLAAFLKLNSLLRVNNAIDVTVVDFINSKSRFNINYQFLSLLTNTRWNIST